MNTVTGGERGGEREERGRGESSGSADHAPDWAGFNEEVHGPYKLSVFLSFFFHEFFLSFVISLFPPFAPPSLRPSYLQILRVSFNTLTVKWTDYL